MKTAIVVGIFLLTVVVFYSDDLFGPNVFLDVNPFHYQPWRSYASQDDLDYKTYRTDSFVTYLPRRHQLSHSIREGRFPVWNPYIFGGMPFFADPQARVIYPVSLLLVGLDPARSMGYDVAIHLLIAMIGMYLFLCRIEATTLAAMLGAFAYAFSSFFYMRMGHPTFVATGAWIPFFFYGFEHARTTGRLGTVLLAVFLAMGYLAGFPQIFLFSVVALTVYALFVSIDPRSGSWRREFLGAVKILSIGGTLAMLLVAVQLVPFLELLRNSSGLGIEFEKMRDIFLTPPVIMLRSLFPNFFGNPVDGTDWSGLTREILHPYNPDYAIYCGMGALMAAAGALCFLRTSRRIMALLVILVASIGLATSHVLLRISYLVPLVGVSRISRVAVLGCFAVSALAGIGMSVLATSRDERLKRRFRYAAGAVVVAVVLAVVVFAALGDSYISRMVDKAGTLPAETWFKTHAQNRSVRIKEWAQTSRGAWVAYEKRQMMRGLVTALVSGGLIIALASLPKSRRAEATVLVGAVVAVVLIDAATTAKQYSISQPSGSLFETRGIRTLRAQLGPPGRWRIRSFSHREEDVKALPPNTHQFYDLHSLVGASTIVPDGHNDLFDAFTQGPVPPRFSGLDTPILPADIMLSDLACVRYTITSRFKVPFVYGPLMKIVAAKGGKPRKVRVISVGGEERLGLLQSPGQTYNLSIEVPDIRAFDFATGFGSDARASGDSISFWLTWTGSGHEVAFRRAFDLFTDRDRWHRFRLDVSQASAGRVRIAMGLTRPRSEHHKVDVAGWSGLEMVSRDCLAREIPGGYRLDVGATGDYISLRLISKAREVPLRIALSDAVSRMRWIGPRPGSSSRHIDIDIRDRLGGRIYVTSDSAFTLTESKIVYLGNAYPAYELISDEEMYVYENHAAVPKGVVISSDAVAWDRSRGQPLVSVAGISEIEQVICGTCSIATYEPEKIDLVVRPERDCILLVQDTFYPGWRARVDGSPRPILRTDTGMRAIELGPGRHDVTMELRPRSITIGLVLTWLGLVLAVVYAKGQKKGTVK